MGSEAITQSLAGRTAIPETDQEWLDWVSAGKTRTWLLNDPLMDWLDLYGEGAGFQRDDQSPVYNPRTDMLPFLLGKGRAFEAAVVEHLRKHETITTVCKESDSVRDLEKANETFAALREGVPIIHQAVLRDAESLTYGAPDLLVRSDVLARLFPDFISPDDATVAAPALPHGRHYRVVDIKFTTLHLLVNGGLGSSGSARAYKGQIYVYNRALGRLQDYLPPRSYLLGRGWDQTVRGETLRGSSCMKRLAPVEQGEADKNGTLADRVDSAIAWMRRLRRNGEDWQVLPRPSVPELWPKMSAGEDAPWHAAKQSIATELGELTTLWQVEHAKRVAAHAAGIFDWRVDSCTAASVGVTGDKLAPTLDAMLLVNRNTDGPSVIPARIHAAEGEWRTTPPLEFYVDFETVSDLDDDFSHVPEKGGQALIFMIGCGHVENGAWQFSCFTAHSLTEDAEARIIDAWFEHMDAVRGRLAPDFQTPLLYHWSHAEQSTLETAYNAAVARHPEKAWPSPAWFDFLKQVMKGEPVLVRGALAFGLKAVAGAFHSLGFIDTLWDAGPTDGLGAMVGAWRCAEEAMDKGCALTDVPLMQEIARYNEVDCKVMMEIVRYLRTHH